VQERLNRALHARQGLGKRRNPTYFVLAPSAMLGGLIFAHCCVEAAGAPPRYVMAEQRAVDAVKVELAALDCGQLFAEADECRLGRFVELFAPVSLVRPPVAKPAAEQAPKKPDRGRQEGKVGGAQLSVDVHVPLVLAAFSVFFAVGLWLSTIFGELLDLGRFACERAAALLGALVRRCT
jgi:hypothetical protein